MGLRPARAPKYDSCYETESHGLIKVLFSIRCVLFCNKPVHARGHVTEVSTDTTVSTTQTHWASVTLFAPAAKSSQGLPAQVI